MKKLIEKHKPNSYCYSGSGMLTNTYDDNVATKMATDSANITMEHSIGFMEWVILNYTKIYSIGLKIGKYVEHNKYDIYINGSDAHFTGLIKSYGKTPQELFNDYLKTL